MADDICRGTFLCNKSGNISPVSSVSIVAHYPERASKPALVSALEYSAFVKSGYTSSAFPLFKKRRSKVIIRVTRKYLFGISDFLCAYLVLAGELA